MSLPTPPEVTIQRFARTVSKLFPPGKLFRMLPSSNVWKYCEVIGLTPARIVGRVGNFLTEMDPRTTVELIDDWKANLGLPDECLTAGLSPGSSWQQAVTAKYLASGGQSIQYFVGVAASLGYTVTIVPSLAAQVLRAGFRAGARAYGTDWAYAWQVTVTAVGSPAVSHAELECVFNRLGPAQAIPVFIF